MKLSSFSFGVLILRFCLVLCCFPVLSGLLGSPWAILCSWIVVQLLISVGGCWLESSTSPSWWCPFMSFSRVQSSESRFFDLLLTSLSSDVPSSQQPNQCRDQLITSGLLLFYVNAISLCFLSHVLSCCSTTWLLISWSQNKYRYSWILEAAINSIVQLRGKSSTRKESDSTSHCLELRCPKGLTYLQSKLKLQ